VDVCPVGALTAKDFRFAMRAWELTATPSVCTGCATGCNIEVHASRDKVYRLVPRENPAVNKFWMCDEGRFTYKGAAADRLAVPVAAGVPVEWDRALDEAGKRLKAVLDRGAVNVGVVFSAQSTNEDLYALGKLAFDSLGLGAPTWPARTRAGRRHPGERRQESQHRRRQGHRRAEAEVAARAQPRPQGGRGHRAAGGRRGGRAGQGGAWRRCRSTSWRRWWCSATHQGPAVDAAHVALPMSMWAEVDGTITNRQGRVQRLRPGIEAAGDSLPGWEILVHLGQRLGMTLDLETAKKVFLGRQGRPRLHEGRRVGPAHLAGATALRQHPRLTDDHHARILQLRTARLSDPGRPLIKVVLLMLVLGPGIASILTWLERRQSSMMQDRLGPTGPTCCRAAGSSCGASPTSWPTP
jgi:NADH-quinone oxidoreductase subunit G